MPDPADRRSPILRKLGATTALSEDEYAAVSRLPLQVATFDADQDIVREGDRPSRCFAVLEGFMCSYKVAAEGKRQIVAFHIPGDVPDIQSLLLTVLDTSFASITPCTLGFVQHEDLKELCARYPRLATAFWRETLIDASMFREWMTSIGRRPAHARVAHILCELVVRMRAAGLAGDHSCTLPITQAELADALGLSVVHVNRTIKELRGAGLIYLRGKVLEVRDWDGLQEAGDFQAGYLHLGIMGP